MLVVVVGVGVVDDIAWYCMILDDIYIYICIYTVFCLPSGIWNRSLGRRQTYLWSWLNRIWVVLEICQKNRVNLGSNTITPSLCQYLQQNPSNLLKHSHSFDKEKCGIVCSQFKVYALCELTIYQLVFSFDTNGATFRIHFFFKTFRCRLLDPQKKLSPF